MKLFILFLTFPIFGSGCAASPKNSACASVQLVWRLSQNRDGTLRREIAAVSPCRGKTFVDAAGRKWTTDFEGRILLSTLDEEKILPPSRETRFLDAFLASWLFAHGYHYLAARQWVSLLLANAGQDTGPTGFCGWWQELQKQGATWERLMAMLPMTAFRDSGLTAASPRHGFLLRFPKNTRIQEKDLGSGASLWVVALDANPSSTLLAFVFPDKADESRIGGDIRWKTEKNGWKTAIIEGKTWVRRDESVFGHRHVWMAPENLRAHLQRIDGAESFSMVDPCTGTAPPPEAKP